MIVFHSKLVSKMKKSSPKKAPTNRVARIRIGPVTRINSVDPVSDSLIAVNNNWALPFFKENDFAYELNPPPPFKTLKPTPVINEMNISQQDRSVLNGKLEAETIQFFLERAMRNNDNDNSRLDFEQLSDVMPVSLQNQPRFQLPPCLSAIGVKYLHVSLSPVTLHTSSFVLHSYRGAVFLWDLETKSVRSEMVQFTVENERMNINCGDEEGFYIEVGDARPSVLLVVILAHSHARQLDHFIEMINQRTLEVDDLSKDPVPFAFSYAAPFHTSEDERRLKFPWFVWDRSDSFDEIWQEKGDRKPNSISLIGNVTTKLMEFNDLPAYSMCGAPDSGKPLLGVSIPQRPFCPRSVIFLSGIAFTFNDCPKGTFAFFRVFMCDDVTNPEKPDGIPLFRVRGGDKLLPYYQSSRVPTGKKIVFPDIVKIKFDSPIRETTTFVLQFFTVSKDKESGSLYKVTAFSLFEDNVILKSGTHSFYTHKPKNVKGSDPLAKCRAVRRSSVVLALDIPPVYFPPLVLDTLITAGAPDQVLWDELTQNLTEDIVLPHIIPIIYKWICLLSPRTVGFLSDVMMLFKDGKGRTELRSWIYNNFDAGKSQRNDFLTHFCTCLSSGLDANSENEAVLAKFANCFDIIFDIMFVSFLRGSEKCFPKFMDKVLFHATDIICFFLERGESDLVRKMNSDMGLLIFYLHSICDCIEVTTVLKRHLRALLRVPKEHFPDAMFAFWTFLMPFSDTKEFALLLASQMPVSQLGQTLFSPYHPVISSICAAFSSTLALGCEVATVAACTFISRLCIPLEDDPGPMVYRTAYAFFPLLDIIARDFGASVDGILRISTSNQRALLSPIIFLLGYTPGQLLKNYFVSFSPNFQIQFIRLFEHAIGTCLEEAQRDPLFVNVFGQLTMRIIQFLLFNINHLSDCLSNVVNVVCYLASAPEQMAKNYPHLFLVVSQIIKLYPWQRPLVSNLLGLLQSKQHIIRCYASSLVLLQFKSDFDARGTVVVSSVDFLDALTTIMLHCAHLSAIDMYKLLLLKFEELSPIFRNDGFTAKMKEPITTARNISELIEKLKNVSHSQERVTYVLRIADQYKTFPSMRVKWLREIVQIHRHNKYFASAFVAQLHICALIATVIEHEQKISSKAIRNPLEFKQFNLAITQPVDAGQSYGIAGDSEAVAISSREFVFIRSVLEEADIDFRSISEDFQFIASDFTVDYFWSSLEAAIELGLQARLFYSVRPLYSLQLRILAHNRKYKEMGEIFTKLSHLFLDLTAIDTCTHNTELSFFLVKNRVYTVERDREPEFLTAMSSEGPVKLKPFEKEGKDATRMEHDHCWDTFRLNPTMEHLNVSDAHSKVIKLVQFVTDTPLPNLFPYANVRDEQTRCISLADCVILDTDRMNRIVSEVADEFERLFTFTDGMISHDDSTTVERGFARVEALFSVLLVTDDSIAAKLTLLKRKGGAEDVIELLKRLTPNIARLFKLFSRINQAIAKPEYSDRFSAVRDRLARFQKEHRLHAFDAKPFKSKTDPVQRAFDYECN